MKHEYHEGEEARDKFEATMKQLFRAPKTIVKPPTKPERKSQETSKD